jgi:hypothetical protein
MNDRDEPLFLQVKEARNSVLAPFTTSEDYAHQGRRVVEGQRLVQAASDMFLGWSTGPAGRHFYLRQLRDMKMAVDVESFDEELLVAYARLCGRVLARAHVRTGNGAILQGYIGGSDAMPEAIAKFAMRYADQTEKDHAAFVKGMRVERKVTAPKQRTFRKQGKAVLKALAKLDEGRKAATKRTKPKRSPARKAAPRKASAKKVPRKASRVRRKAKE